MTIVMAEGAMSGDDKSYKAVMDSAYGYPTQEIDTTVTGHIAIHVDNQDAKLGE